MLNDSFIYKVLGFFHLQSIIINIFDIYIYTFEHYMHSMHFCTFKSSINEEKSAV